ncbi:MAG: sigma-70 family RNA polymerase sigma factor [Oscillospiraceae bacterium]
MADGILELIYEKYYTTILTYCCLRLHNNIHAAEDCTQEVFLITQKKLPRLVNLEEIKPWLYRTAENVVKNYRKKNPEMIDIDSIPETPQEMPVETALDILTDEERELVRLYYLGESKEKLAHQQGMTVDALYKKISRIKEKLRKRLDEING